MVPPHLPAGISETVLPNNRREWLLGFGVVLVISIGYMWMFIDRGWIPHDEGTLAQSAERVLAGEVAHRDFVHGYTGGLNYIHALAFKIFGVSLLSMRYALMSAFVAWVVVFYHAATRLTSVVGAVVVTLAAVFWSVPNYPAPMPSWYNLFLATAGVSALLEHMTSGRRRWVFLAGLAGGLSVLMKLHGLLFIAAGLLFLFYHHSEDDAPNKNVASLLVRWAVIAILALAVLAVLAIGISRRFWVDVYLFTLPGLAMVGVVGQRTLRNGGPGGASASRILRACGTYLTGAAIPIVAFGIYYAALGALPELVTDILYVSASALEGASLKPAAPFGLLFTAIALFIVSDFSRAPKLVAVFQAALAIAAIALMLVPVTAQALEPMVWASLAEATPVVILLLAVLAVRSAPEEAGAIPRSRLILVGCVAAFCSLVQYPFTAPIYFSYSLPLLLLAIAGVVPIMAFVRRRAVFGLGVVYAAFGALYISPMNLPGILGPVIDDEVAALDLPRGKLRIPPLDAASYAQAVQLLNEHNRAPVTYAGPDAPDFYFLSGLKNPTSVMFDYQTADTLFYPHILAQLDSWGVNAIALRRRVAHSPALPPDVLGEFETKYPFSQTVGRFIIRWR